MRKRERASEKGEVKRARERRNAFTRCAAVLNREMNHGKDLYKNNDLKTLKRERERA